MNQEDVNSKKKKKGFIWNFLERLLVGWIVKWKF